jgi:signal transduction histidine kinase
MVPGRPRARSGEFGGRAAQRITHSNLDVQIPARNTGDELDRLIEAFNHMMTRLNHSFEQIRQFSTDVSHELRTPLTVVRGQLEVALFTAQTVEQYREAMADALEGVERLSNIVRALLMLSQAESGQLVLQKNQLDLAGLVRDLVDQHQIPAEAEGRPAQRGPARALHLNADRIQIERLVSNLVGQRHQIHAGRRKGEGQPGSELRSREADRGGYRRGHLA